MIEKLLRLEGPAVRDVIGVPADRREDRRERLRIALAMIGGGLLRRNTEGGVRSEELGVVGRGEMSHAEARRTRSVVQN